MSEKDKKELAFLLSLLTKLLYIIASFKIIFFI